VESADEVLALRGVDPGLAANRTVDLGQKRRRQLHKPHAPAQDRRRKTDEVADHAATQRQDHILALDLLLQQPFGAACEVVPVLRPLARRQGQGRGRDPLRLQRCSQCGQVAGRDGFVGHHGHALPPQQGRDLDPRPRQKTGTDPHLVRA